jgi:hypothetical protein
MGHECHAAHRAAARIARTSARCRQVHAATPRRRPIRADNASKFSHELI